jgi:hypothetical protein
METITHFSSAERSAFSLTSMKRGIIAAAVLASSSTLTMGCGAPAGGPTENVGVTQDALSGLIFATWGGVGAGGLKFSDGTPSTLDLGVGNGWTCWLAGVTGSLGGFGSGQNVTVYQAPSVGQPVTNVRGGQIVGTIPPNEWVLQMSTVNVAISGTAVCAPSTPLGGVQGTEENDPNLPDPLTLLGPTDFHSWCGLEGLANYNDPMTNEPQWSSPDSAANLTRNNAMEWTLETTSAFALAQCAQANVSGIWGYHIVAPSSGTASFNLLQNNMQPLPSGTVCFLTDVQGAFTDSNFSDGVFISLSSSGLWSMTATNGKQGSAMCIL